MNRLTVQVWALSLILIGLAVAAYKVLELGLPLEPRQNTDVWTLQAQVTFRGSGGPAKLSLDIPKITPGFSVLDEDFISGKYGLALEQGKDRRSANWAIRRARGDQSVYYRITLARSGQAAEWETVPRFPSLPEYPEPYASAIQAIIEDVREESADVESYTQALLRHLNSTAPSENVELLRDRARTTSQWIGEIINVLKGVRIPAREIQGIDVANLDNHAVLSPMLQVHNGDHWLTFDAETGKQGIPANYVVWKVGSGPVARLTGGRRLEVQFSVTKTYAEVVDVVRQGAERRDSLLANFSLAALPVQDQNVYRLLLMLPLGALLVVFLRTIIGFQTFGTFMPILVALAFRETQLFWGVIMFSLIVSIGLMMRFYMERLMLLLIPRLAAILIIVVILMLLISLTSNRLGMERLLSISLFPMVILAMTIERMSITWEESGARQAILLGLGSLVVACGAYLIMTNENLMYLMFVYPELLLVILGLTLWMGRYTGYRLVELVRFREILHKDMK